MMIRCGACRTQFDVPGEGRYACPSCGSVNLVRGPGGGGQAPPPGTNSGTAPPNQQPPPPGQGGIAQPGVGTQPAPESEVPAPRITCDDCGFEFIVGDIAVATCPNCGAEVQTGFHDEDE